MQLIVVEILLVEFDSVARFGCRRSVVTQLTSEFCLMFVAFNTFYLFHRLVLMFGQMHLILFESDKMRSQTIVRKNLQVKKKRKKKRLTSIYQHYPFSSSKVSLYEIFGHCLIDVAVTLPQNVIPNRRKQVTLLSAACNRNHLASFFCIRLAKS